MSVKHVVNVLSGRGNALSIDRYFSWMLLFFILVFVLLPTSKAVNNFYYVFLAFPTLWALARGKWGGINSTALLWMWVAFLGWLLIGLVQVQTLQYLKHWIYVSLFCGMVVLLVDYRFFQCDRVKSGLFLVVLTYVLLSALYLWVLGAYHPGDRIARMPMRLYGPTYGSIVLVAFFALAAVGTIRNNRWLTFVIWSALVILVTGYILQSRAGVVGALAVIGLVVFHALWSSKHWWHKLSVIIFAIFIVVFLWFLFDSVPAFELLIKRADSGRFELWGEYYQRFTGCLTWLGCSPDNFEGIYTFSGRQLVEHPHNIFFSILLYHGWVGFSLFLGIIVMSFLTAWRQRNPWGLFLFTSMLMLMFDGSGLVNQPNELWLLILLPCMLILAERSRLSGTLSMGS